MQIWANYSENILAIDPNLQSVVFNSVVRWDTAPTAWSELLGLYQSPDIDAATKARLLTALAASPNEPQLQTVLEGAKPYTGFVRAQDITRLIGAVAG